MSNLQRIRAIAHRVRKWAEKLQEQRGERGMWDENLGCMCGICAYEIFKRARRAGMRCRIAMSCHHAFVIYHGRVVDVTATQFGNRYPKVVVRRLKGSNDSIWKVRQIFRTTKALRIEMKHWENQQNPFLIGAAND